MEHNKNLRNRPETVSYSEEQQRRGPGQLDSIDAYLRNDPTSYFYQKFSRSKNPYLRDDFWTEAARQGESESLIHLLEMTKSDSFSSEAIEVLSGYGDRLDYDTYLFALELPHLDNETKKMRTDEGVFDENGVLVSPGTGTEFGEFTDKEWAWEILKHTIGRWDAEIIEEDKARRTWFANMGTQLVSGITNLVGGALNFTGDIYNIGEGLLNMLFNWSNDDNIGDRFNYAFTTDNALSNIGTWLNNASYEFQRKYASTVDAVQAHEEGYRLHDKLSDAEGVGAGYSTWGRWMNAGSNAVGYMIPTIVLGKVTGGASTAATAAGKAAAGKALGLVAKSRSLVYYGGIFSGKISENIQTEVNSIEGISYKDLDAGRVIANAAIKSAASYAVAYSIGRIIGFSGVDRLLGIGSKAIGKAGTKAGTKAVAGVAGTTTQAGLQVLKTTGKHALKEGITEVFQETSGIVTDYFFGGTYKDRGLQNLSIQTVVDSFVVGALASVVTGSVGNVTTYFNQAKGVNADGEAFKLGTFKTLNLREATMEMHKWNEVINDNKSSVEAKAQAMLAMNAALATLGDVYKNMGTERALKADAVIMDMLNMESKTKQLEALKSNTDYVNKLWNDFKNAQVEANLKHIKKDVEKKIKKALGDKAEIFKEKGVSEIDDVITVETVANDNIDKGSLDKLQKYLESEGYEAIVGMDGQIVTSSGDIIFANKDLIKKGDIEGIIKGQAYNLTVNTVIDNLNRSQRKLILDSYNKITGLEGTLNDAVIALLFDKEFYTYILLKSAERGYKESALKMLATIDKLLSSKLTPEVAKQTIGKRAYKLLLKKVQKNMQTGLISYATQHALLDLSTVSLAVLPSDLRKEINNHKNVRFTKMVNAAVTDGHKTNTTIDIDRAGEFDKSIDKFKDVLSPSEIEWAKKSIRSKEYNDRKDAGDFLVLQTKRHTRYADNVTYLPTDPSTQINDAYVQQTAEVFGTDWDTLVHSDKPVPNTNEYNMDDRQSRLAAVRIVLFNKSGKTLTINNDGILMQVVDKETFVSDNYKGAKGEKALKKDIKDSKVETLQDISKIKLDSRLANLKLVLSAKPMPPGHNGYYIDGSNEIVLAGTDMLNAIMHEVTHAVQYILGVGTETIQGGSADAFAILPNKVQDSLITYIKDNFPLCYRTLKGSKLSNSEIIYFMLEGELQANSSLSSVIFETGFRWENKNDNTKTTYLISPDGKQRWSMEPSRHKEAPIRAILEDAEKKTKKKATDKKKKAKDSVIPKKAKGKHIVGKNNDAQLDNLNKVYLKQLGSHVDDYYVAKKINVTVYFELQEIYGNRVKLNAEGEPFIEAEKRGRHAILYHGTNNKDFDFNHFKKHTHDADYLFVSTVPEYSDHYGKYLFEIKIPFFEYQQLSNAQIEMDIGDSVDFNLEIWRATEHACQRVINNKDFTDNQKELIITSISKDVINKDSLDYMNKLIHTKMEPNWNEVVKEDARNKNFDAQLNKITKRNEALFNDFKFDYNITDEVLNKAIQNVAEENGIVTDEMIKKGDVESIVTNDGTLIYKTLAHYYTVGQILEEAGNLVSDEVYNYDETEFLKRAEKLSAIEPGTFGGTMGALRNYGVANEVSLFYETDNFNKKTAYDVLKRLQRLGKIVDFRIGNVTQKVELYSDPAKVIQEAIKDYKHGFTSNTNFDKNFDVTLDFKDRDQKTKKLLLEDRKTRHYRLDNSNFKFTFKKTIDNDFDYTSLEHIPGNVAAEPTAGLEFNKAVNKFYEKYPLLRAWVEGMVEKTFDAKIEMTIAYSESMQLLYNELYLQYNKGTFEKFLKTPIYFVRTQNANKVTTDKENDVVSVTLNYDLEQLSIFNATSNYLFYGKILPTDLMVYLPLSYEEGIVNSYLINNENVINTSKLQKEIKSVKDYNEIETKAQNELKEKLSSLPKGLEGINYDAPISKEGLNKLRDNPEIKDFMKDSYLKLTDDTPLVLYRGVKHEVDGFNSIDNNLKIGEFYNLEYEVSKGYSENNSLIRGFIANISKKNIEIYDGQNKNWNDLNSTLSLEDKKIQSHLIKIIKPFNNFIHGVVAESSKNYEVDADKINSKITEALEHYYRSNKIEASKIINEWNNALNDIMKTYNVSRNTAIRALTTLSFIPQAIHFGVTTDVLMVINKLKGKEAIIIKNVKDNTSSSSGPTTDIILLKPNLTKRVTVPVDTTNELPKGLEGINYDAPLSKEGLDKLRNKPEIKDYMKDAYLKTGDGTPLVWYRGTKSESEFNTVSDSKLGEFYTLDYYTAKYNYSKDDSLVRGFISNVTKNNTVVYDAQNKNWADLRNVLTTEDKNTLQHLRKLYNAVNMTMIFVRASLDDNKTYTSSELENKLLTYLKNNGNLDIVKPKWDNSVKEIMTKYNVNKDLAITTLFTLSNINKTNNATTDTLMVLNRLKGKDAIIIKNVIDGSEGIPITELILLKSNLTKRVTVPRDINYDKQLNPDSRTMKNKIAKESNMKYWIKKGAKIQAHPKVREFVIGTTKEFDKLPDFLRNKIKSASLNYFDLLEFTATAANMNDFTFKALAKYFFNNEALADITPKEMDKLIYNIEELTALSFVLNEIAPEMSTIEMTPAEMVKLHQDIMKKAKDSKNDELATKYAKAITKAQTSRTYTSEGIKYVESHVDPKQLNLVFFKHYRGNLQSLTDINNLGKYTSHQQTEQRVMENVKTGTIEGQATTGKKKHGKKKDVWNWLDKMRKAEIDYTYSHDVSQSLNEIPTSQKLNAIRDYLGAEMARRLEAEGEVKNLKQRQMKIVVSINQILEKLEDGSEKQLNQKYLAVLANLNATEKERTVENFTKFQPRSAKNIKDHLRQAANTVSKRVANPANITTIRKKPHIKEGKTYRALTSAELEKLPSEIKKRYNILPNSVKNVIDPVTFELKTYQSMSNAELEKILTVIKNNVDEQTLVKINNIKKKGNQKLSSYVNQIAKITYDKLPNEVKSILTYQSMNDADLENLLEDMKDAAKDLANFDRQNQIKIDEAIKAQERLAKLAVKRMKVDSKGKQVDPSKKKSLREKISPVLRTKIVDQKFSFESRENPTDTAKKLLGTQWGKRRTSTVQALSNNKEQNIHKGKVFFEQNVETLMSQTTTEAEATALWFMDANMIGVSAESNEHQTFQSVKLLYLGYVLSETKVTDGKTGRFSNMNSNIKKRIENHIKAVVTAAGTTMSNWQGLIKSIDPVSAMKNADMEIAGVILTPEEKDQLLDAASSGDIEGIVKAQNLIIERVMKEKTTKKSVLRKITALRSMSMLSAPTTWLRNIISNSLLEQLNPIASKIGDKVFTSKAVKGQFKMDGQVTPEIQAFITEHFIDNKLYDTLISTMSKYNPSGIKNKYKDSSGTPTKEAIFANMVIKSMYNRFYNKNMFDNPNLNKLQQGIMKMLSDNRWVREASIRYFGKIIAERGYTLDKGVTDSIMADFANAVGMGMADYMHSDNFFNQIEGVLAEKSELGLFVYKTILPFAAMSWNWFKAAMRYSPVGLANSIYKLATLEQQIIKAENNWAKGKSQIAPEMTQFLIRREFGSGVIGTIAFGFGAILAALGYVDLEDEDYGTPKLRIGNTKFDVSRIFGSSSVLAGMGLVKGFQNENSMEAFDNMFGSLLNGFFLIQILEMDKYNRGGLASLGTKFLEQTILSFLPNGLRWLSGATYSGTYQTNNMFQRAVARIPFFGSIFKVPKKTNPYTGDQGSMWDAFNRVVPYLEVRQTSAIEEESKALGINRKQLRGKYEVNGKEFELSARDTAELNKQYGEWNALALSLFYDNKSAHSVQMENGTYRVLSYNQMTEDQRRRVVQNITSANARYAKIQAWLNAGNTYYATKSDFQNLRSIGVTGKLYRGNRGFIEG